MQRKKMLLTMLKTARRSPLAQRELHTSEVTAHTIARTTNGRNYFLEKEKARALFEDTYIPKRRDRIRASLRRGARRLLDPKRKKLAEEVFRPTGRHAIMVIRPELFSQRAALARFLRERGIRVQLAKTALFDRTDLFEMYGQKILEDNKKYDNLPIFAAHTQSAPCRLFVIRFRDEFSDAATKEKTLSALKEDIRAHFVDPLLDTHLFGKGHMTNVGFNLDATGYIQNKHPQRSVVRQQYSGVHMPDAQAAVRDAQFYFNAQELTRISKKG